MEGKDIQRSVIALAEFIWSNAAEIHKRIYPDNLSSEYGFIIAYLCENEGKNIYQRDVEKAFKMSRSTVSTILKELEREGLVERKSVITDARLKKVVATEAAKLINDACQKEIDAFTDKLFSGINTKELDVISGVLNVLEIKKNNMIKNAEQKARQSEEYEG
ncbi:MAG: MarR family transcriptional regulator [Eubacteriales bacterium]|nr:MarR family transcriptional regulator [Eubacteriales bacterium]